MLAVVEPEVSVGDVDIWDRPNLHVDSDYTFSGMSPKSASRTVYWVADPTFTTQVNYEFNTPCVLECRPPLGPDADIAPGGRFETFRTFELVPDSTDRERKGLAVRRMYRTIAPWVTENPDLPPSQIDRAGRRPAGRRPMRGRRLRDDHPQLRQRPGHGERGSRLYRPDEGAGRLRPLQGHRAGRLFAPGQPPHRRRGRRHQSQDGQARRGDLRQFALPRQRLGPRLFPPDHRLLRKDGLRHPRARRLLSRRRLRLDAAIPATAAWPIRSGRSGGRSPTSTPGAAAGASISTSPTGTSWPARTRPPSATAK